MRILGLIPARGGSKGIPRKNIRLLGGKPLLQYTAEAALASAKLSRVVLTTEDEEIAEVGRRLGVEVPFLRPAGLALDHTPSLPVVQHAVRTLEAEGDAFDAICLLQPTTPMRSAVDIDACIELFERSRPDAVISVLEVPAEYNPHWVYFQKADGSLHLSTGDETIIPRRQELPAAYHRNGAVFVTRRETLMEKNSLYGDRLIGYPMDPARSVNIDTEKDWERARRLLESPLTD
jgi:CMP-N,N'-diacetyllegionaminic acid synthase